MEQRMLSRQGVASGAMCLAVVTVGPQSAQDRKAKADASNAVDLGDVFGFTVPTDPPGMGARELAHDTLGRSGKTDGSFRVFVTKAQIGSGVTSQFASINGIDQTFVVQRGTGTRMTFTAEKTGVFHIEGATHKPSMSAALVVIANK